MSFENVDTEIITKTALSVCDSDIIEAYNENPMEGLSFSNRYNINEIKINQ